MNQPPSRPATPETWPRTLVWAASLAWVLALVASAVLPDWLTRPGDSHWDTLGYFLVAQFVAAGIAAIALLLTVIFWATGRIGTWTRVVGLIPAIVTLAGVIWLTVFAE